MKPFIRRAAIVWACVGALLLVWSGAARGVDAAKHDTYKDDLRQYQTLEHFFNVVAGKENPRPGVLDKLARDLRDLSPGEVSSFRGDSNRYGGITDELGFDPFAGENCHECGALKADFAANVLRAKSGDVDGAIGPKPKQEGDAIRPPFLVWLAWLFSLPVAVFSRRRREEKKYASMDYEAHLLRELGDTMKGLPPGSPGYDELSHLQHKLQGAMDERLEYGDSAKTKMRIEELKRDANDSLDSITEGNRALR